MKCYQNLRKQIQALEQRLDQINKYDTDALTTDMAAITNAITENMETFEKRQVLNDIFSGFSRKYAIIVSSNTRVMYVSPNCKEITGHEADEIINENKFEDVLKYIKASDRASTKADHLQRVNNTNLIGFKTIALKNGKVIKVLSQANTNLDGTLNIITRTVPNSLLQNVL